MKCQAPVAYWADAHPRMRVSGRPIFNLRHGLPWLDHVQMLLWLNFEKVHANSAWLPQKLQLLRTLLARTNHHPEPATSLAVRPGPTQEHARATLRESKSKGTFPPPFFFSLNFGSSSCKYFKLKNNREHLRAFSRIPCSSRAGWSTGVALVVLPFTNMHAWSYTPEYYILYNPIPCILKNLSC